MIKVAFNKENPKLVFAVESKTRVAIGNAGIKECYVGTLLDYSKDPATIKENHKEQVTAFDSKWQECPVEITDADEDSGEDDTEPSTEGGDTEPTTFPLSLKYSTNQLQIGIYPILVEPVEMMFNLEFVKSQGRVMLGEHATVYMNDTLIPNTEYYIKDVPADGGWELFLTGETAMGIMTANGGLEGVEISISADANIATMDDTGATNEAFETTFVYGEDLPDSAYPGDYTPEPTSEVETEPQL
jgi:hypothetical protein